MTNGAHAAIKPASAFLETDSNRLCNAVALILLEKTPTSIDQPLPDSTTSA
jgi:hypothetical protein